MMESAPITWHVHIAVMAVVGALGQLIGCYFDTQGQSVDRPADAATQDVRVDADSRRDTGGQPCTTFECDGVCVQLDDPRYGCAWGRCTPCRQPRNPAAEEVTCFEQECVSVCKDAFASCDSRVEGCPIDLNTDVRNCDRCGGICVVAHGTAACQGGQCRIARCDEGFANCNQLADDQGYSDGCETDRLNDKAHCGGCGNNCDDFDPTGKTKFTCRHGRCEPSNCAEGWGDCISEVFGCETNLNNTVDHCKQCRSDCRTLPYVNASTVTCEQGLCVIAAGTNGCQKGYGNCDGEVNNGCEVDLSRDVTHCGKCANKCGGSEHHSSSPKCEDSKCVHNACDIGYRDCNAGDPPSSDDGCETDIRNDENNCGACGTKCPGTGKPNVASVSCENGSCKLSCKGSFKNCDNDAGNGCEVDIRNDENNCGACDTKCPLPGQNNVASAWCEDGSCRLSCSGQFGDCDNNLANGCETNTTISNEHCGGCNKPCVPTANHAQYECQAGSDGKGVCMVTSCESGYGNCDGLPDTGCEIQLGTNEHCARCDDKCSVPGDVHVSEVQCQQTGAEHACTITRCEENYKDCNKILNDGCEVNGPCP